MKVLMIIPAYNEELNIEKTIDGILDYKKNSKYDLDYIIINDGSIDGTLEICKKNKYNYIDLIQNLGIGGAVQTGYKYAYKHNYDVAIQFDGDGQHDEQYIDILVDEIKKGFDFVIGSRFIQNLSEYKSSWIRRIGIIILSKLIRICTGKKIYDVTSGFRASNKRIIELFVNNYPSEYPEPESTVEVIKKGYKVKEIAVNMKERKYGKSFVTPFKSAYYMFSVSISIIVASILKEVK